MRIPKERQAMHPAYQGLPPSVSDRKRGAAALREGDIKTIARNFLAYPFQFLYVLLVLLIAQFNGLIRRMLHALFSRKELP